LQYRHAELSRMYKEAIEVFVDRRNEIAGLIAKNKYDDALQRAKSCRTAITEEMRQLADRTAQLRNEIGSAKISLADCEEAARFLDKYMVVLNQRIGELEEAYAIANDPAKKAAEKKLNELHTQANSLRDAFKIDEAIAILKQIVGNTKEFGEQSVVK